jgi:hypothetical protein
VSVTVMFSVIKKGWLEVVQHIGNLGNHGDHEIEGIPHEDQLRIVGNAVARCSMVDDASGGRGNLAEGMDVLG